MAVEKAKPAGESGQSGQGLIFALILSVLGVLALGLFLVWLNIERTKLAYRLRELQKEVENRVELGAKLSVERDHLLSPQQLDERAAAMGLFKAKAGQIRRMDLPESPQDTKGIKR